MVMTSFGGAIGRRLAGVGAPPTNYMPGRIPGAGGALSSMEGAAQANMPSGPSGAAGAFTPVGGAPGVSADLAAGQGTGPFGNFSFTPGTDAGTLAGGIGALWGIADANPNKQGGASAQPGAPGAVSGPQGHGTHGSSGPQQMQRGTSPTLPNNGAYISDGPGFGPQTAMAAAAPAGLQGADSTAQDTYENAVGQAGLQFNPLYAQQYRDLQSQEASARSGADLALQRLTQDIQSRMQGLDQGENYARSQLLDRLASQGILRSGINAGEQGRIGQEYNMQRQDLQQQGARFQDDTNRGLVDQIQQLLGQKTGLLGQQARDEAASRAQQAQQQATSDAIAQILAANNAQQATQAAAQPQPTGTGQYQYGQSYQNPSTLGALQSKIAAFTQGIRPKYSFGV